MKKNKSFESKDLLPSFILEGSSPDYEIIPEDINDINHQMMEKTEIMIKLFLIQILQI